MTTTTSAEQFLSAQQARAVIARDRWQRPLVERPDGTIGAYTRSSTLGKALDEGSGLANWKARQAVIGVASRKDLVLAANAHRADNQKMNEIVEQGMEAAGSSAAATTGTALHDLCDQVDHGAEPYIPDEFAPDVHAYRDATTALEVISAEQFAVCDELEVAGTPDRVYRLLAPLIDAVGTTLVPAGELIIGDIKTGKSLDFGHLTYSVQLAAYARSHRYDLSTGRTRTYGRTGDIPVGDRHPWVPGEQVNTAWGLIVHLPAGKGRASLHPVDLTAGWELAQLAATVRGWRRRKDIIGAPIQLEEDFHTTAKAAQSLAELFSAYTRAEEAGKWSEVLRKAFSRRKAELREVA